MAIQEMTLSALDKAYSSDKLRFNIAVELRKIA